jgi:hypothetical protein
VAPVIRIDTEVMAELKKRAIAFNLVFEPPNSTLRMMLGLDSQAADAAIQPKPQRSGKEGEYVVEGTGTLFYVRRAKQRYADKITDEEGFVTEVWGGIRDSAERSGRGQHVVERATEAFLQLYEKNGRSPVSHSDILRKAGLEPDQGLLWPWLLKNAGVIRKEKDELGNRRYSIPDDAFYAALRKVVLRPAGTEKG